MKRWKDVIIIKYSAQCVRLLNTDLLIQFFFLFCNTNVLPNIKKSLCEPFHFWNMTRESTIHISFTNLEIQPTNCPINRYVVYNFWSDVCHVTKKSSIKRASLCKVTYGRHPHRDSMSEWSWSPGIESQPAEAYHSSLWLDQWEGF